jgi:hypothetical protein
MKAGVDPAGQIWRYGFVAGYYAEAALEVGSQHLRRLADEVREALGRLVDSKAPK